MTDVFLINCPIAFKKNGEMLGDETTNPPLGLLYIASYLERSGISVKVFDVRAENLSLSDILRKIKKENPKVIGLSAMTPSIRAAVELAKEIRGKFGHTEPVIVLGGAHLCADPDFIRRFPVFDFGVVGEGEILFTQLMKKILRGRKLNGLYFAEPIKDLNKLPFPARHLINKANYYGAINEDISQKERCKMVYASLIGSRGCPFHCSFCSKSVYKNVNRVRSPENVYQEMEEIFEDYGGYIFMDDTLTLHRENTFRLCQLLISSGKRFRWMAMTRASSVDEKLLKIMAQAGCHDLFFGVESGNEKIRNQVIKKNVKDREIFQAVRLCRKYGIQSNLFLMLGFPEETEKEIEDMVNFGKKAKADFIGIHITVPLPGAEIFNIAIKEGKLDKDIIDKYARGELGKNFKRAWPLYVPNGMNLEALVEAKKRTYRNFYLDPGWIWRRVQRDLRYHESLKQDFRMIKTGIYALLHGETKYSMS